MNEKLFKVIVAELAALKTIVLNTPELKSEFDKILQEKLVELEKDISSQASKEN